MPRRGWRSTPAPRGTRRSACGGGDGGGVDSLADYQVGEATLTDTGAQVVLDGPEEAATLLVDEDGELKASELFVTPDANTPGGADAAPGSVQPSG